MNFVVGYDLFIGLPFSLDLPDGELVSIGGMTFGGEEAADEGNNSSYTREDGYEDKMYGFHSYGNPGHHGYGRSLDRQRKKGYDFIQQVLERLLENGCCIILFYE